MNEQQQVLLMLQGAISNAPEDSQKKIKLAAESIRKIIDDNGEEGQVALALVGAEFAAQ